MDKCPTCGGLFSLIGRSHRCVVRGGAEVARLAHNQKAGGSSPPPATKLGRKPSLAENGVVAKPREPAAPKTSPAKSREGVKRLGARGPAPGSGGRPRKGAEKKTLRATKPWEKEGISQSTWYRRRREAK